MQKGENEVVYPLRMPREVYQRAQQIAADHDLSTAQLIRLAVRRVVAKAEAGKAEDQISGI